MSGNRLVCLSYEICNLHSPNLLSKLPCSEATYCSVIEDLDFTAQPLSENNPLFPLKGVKSF